MQKVIGDLKKPGYATNDLTTTKIKMQTSANSVKQVLTIVANYLLATVSQPEDVRSLRIRVPRVVHCDDCPEFRVLQRFEPNSVCWKCESCVH